MNNLNLLEIFSIIIIHFIGDFVLQTDKQAKGKSKNWNDLLNHTAVYSLIWFIPIFIMIYYYHYNPLLWIFPFITFIAHTITDYLTSRLNSKLWTKGDVHNFFVSVGFDQVLHYVQLFTTYYLLKN